MIRILFSLLGLIILLVSGFFFYMDYGSVAVIPILRYEHIAISESKAPGYVHPRDFQSQMNAIADEKLNVISLAEVANIYRTGQKIPNRTIAITVDGGYDDFLENAWGTIIKNKFPATLFVQSAHIGEKGYMTDKQILQVAQRGNVEIGSNGLTGKNLRKMNSNDAYSEIFSSRTAMQKDFKIPISYFSFAQGGFNPGLILLVKQSGYQGSCVMTPGKNVSNHDPYLMKRITVTDQDRNPIYFRFKTWGNYVLYQEWRERRK